MCFWSSTLPCGRCMLYAAKISRTRSSSGEKANCRRYMVGHVVGCQAGNGRALQACPSCFPAPLACNGHFWFRFALRRTVRLASRGDVGPRGVRLSPVAAACYMQLKSRGQTLRRGKSRQQDTLSATALPSERPVVLPTVWETAEAGHWDCVGTHSSWQKARQSTSSGKML